MTSASAGGFLKLILERVSRGQNVLETIFADPGKMDISCSLQAC